MEQITEILIITHAVSGGFALIFGAGAIIAKKGKLIHRKSGKLFFYTMLFSAVIAIIVSILPGHKNLFLLSIGIFSSYFLISGYRSLRFKRKNVNLGTDRLIAYLILLTGISMVFMPIFLLASINLVLLVFGITGIIFGIRDLMAFRDPQKLRKAWLGLHLGKMTGGYIAAVTAFFVVNNILPGIYNWFAPGVIGGCFIAYWLINLNRKTPLTTRVLKEHTI